MTPQQRYRQSPKGKAAQSRAWKRWYAKNRQKMTEHVTAWKKAQGRAWKTYERLRARRRRYEAGSSRVPCGHSWSATQRFHARMMVWMRRYNPQMLYLLK